MDKLPWVAFFSQTGAEIADLSEVLGRWPSRIITNKRPSDLRTIDPRIVEQGYIEVPNRPTETDLRDILQYFDDPIITLHGWLRVMPADICSEYNIYNGHPGLITEYPELKGKDPQQKAWAGIQMGKYPIAGAVLHKVTAGVDEGEILDYSCFSVDTKLSLDNLFRILKGVSLDLWVKFLKENL